MGILALILIMAIGQVRLQIRRPPAIILCRVPAAKRVVSIAACFLVPALAVLSTVTNGAGPVVGAIGREFSASWHVGVAGAYVNVCRKPPPPRTDMARRMRSRKCEHPHLPARGGVVFGRSDRCHTAFYTKIHDIEETRVPMPTFDDQSVEHLAQSIAIHLYEMEGKRPPRGFRGGVELDSVLSTMSNSNASPKAREMAGEAWHLLVADGYISPCNYYDHPRSGPPGYVKYAPTERLRKAVGDGMILVRMQVQEDIASVLHTDVRNAAWSKVRDGDLQDAVMAATHRLEVRLKLVSSEDGTMDVVAGKAFGRNGSLRNLMTERESENWMHMFRSMTQLIRNPTHHEAGIINDRTTCLQILSFLSFLYGQLDHLDSLNSNP